MDLKSGTMAENSALYQELIIIVTYDGESTVLSLNLLLDVDLEFVT